MAGPWEEYAAAESGPWTTFADVAKSGGVGLARGAIGVAGLVGDLSEFGARGIDRASRYVGGKIGVDVPKREDRPPDYGSADITKAVQGVTGEFYKPKTTAGEYAQTVGEFAPGLIGGPGGLLRRAVTQVVAPGVASEGAGQAAKAYAPSYEPYARVAGAMLGGVAPTLAGRAVSPMPINAERAAAVQTLRNEGVADLTAGQVTGRKPLQYLEAERGRGANLMETQAEQFTGAALRRVGENAPRATPEVVDRAFARIGGEFDRLAANNVANVDQQFAQNLRNAVDDYHNLVSPPNRAPVIDNFVTEIRTAAQRSGGVLPGDVYQSIRSRMERAARGMGNNPEARTALREMREAVDDAMERTIIASGNAADAAAWQQARQQYRNLLVVERAATGAGEGAAGGLISPAKLREATVGVQGRRNYARGDGEFADLARSGVQVMSPLPNSGTAGRFSAQNLGVGLSSIVGGAAGGAAGGGDPTATIAGILAGGLLPRGVGRAATSAVGRAYLGNQRATPMLNNLTPGQAAVVDALMAAQQQRPELQR